MTLTFVLESLPAIIARPSHSEVLDLDQSRDRRAEASVSRIAGTCRKATCRPGRARPERSRGRGRSSSSVQRGSPLCALARRQSGISLDTSVQNSTASVSRSSIRLSCLPESSDPGRVVDRAEREELERPVGNRAPHRFRHVGEDIHLVTSSLVMRAVSSRRSQRIPWERADRDPFRRISESICSTRCRTGVDVRIGSGSPHLPVRGAVFKADLDASAPIDAIQDQDSRLERHPQRSDSRRGVPACYGLVEMHLPVYKTGDCRKNVGFRIARPGIGQSPGIASRSGVERMRTLCSISCVLPGGSGEG